MPPSQIFTAQTFSARTTYVATAWVIGANGYGYIAVEFD